MPCEPTIFVCQFVYVGNGFLTLQGGSVPVYPLLGWIDEKNQIQSVIFDANFDVFYSPQGKILFNQCLLKGKPLKKHIFLSIT